jgi:hypothetical protein
MVQFFLHTLIHAHINHHKILLLVAHKSYYKTKYNYNRLIWANVRTNSSKKGSKRRAYLAGVSNTCGRCRVEDIEAGELAAGSRGEERDTKREASPNLHGAHTWSGAG